MLQPALYIDIMNDSQPILTNGIGDFDLVAGTISCSLGATLPAGGDYSITFQDTNRKTYAYTDCTYQPDTGPVPTFRLGGLQPDVPVPSAWGPITAVVVEAGSYTLLQNGSGFWNDAEGIISCGVFQDDDVRISDEDGYLIRFNTADGTAHSYGACVCTFSGPYSHFMAGNPNPQ